MPTPKKTDSKTASKEAAAPKKKCCRKKKDADRVVALYGDAEDRYW